MDILLLILGRLLRLRLWQPLIASSLFIGVHKEIRHSLRQHEVILELLIVNVKFARSGTLRNLLYASYFKLLRVRHVPINISFNLFVFLFEQLRRIDGIVDFLSLNATTGFLEPIGRAERAMTQYIHLNFVLHLPWLLFIL